MFCVLYSLQLYVSNSKLKWDIWFILYFAHFILCCVQHQSAIIFIRMYFCLVECFYQIRSWKKNKKTQTISTNFYQSLSQYVVLSNYSCCVETVLNLTPLQHHKYMNTFTTVPHSLFKYKCFVNLFTTPRYSSNTNIIGVKHQSIYLFITFYSPPLFNK